ncbi:hypothetical protein ACLB2K_070835 [Fragaria x ananassa]
MEHIHFLKSPISLILPILFIAFILGCFPTVRSEQEPSFIKLPSESQPADVCPVVVKSPVQALSCPVNCFRPDPVCGVNGVTYWCGCREAQCAGVKVAKLGFCEVGNGGAAPLSAQALLLVHIVWLIVLGFSVLFGLF